MSALLLKFVKFCVVGASGVIVDFGLTFLCKEKLGFNKYVANSIGFLAAASSNYLLNRWWTFESSNPNISMEYASFLLVSLVGLAINNGVIWWIHEKVGVNFYLAKIGGIAAATFWNFFANYTFTF